MLDPCVYPVPIAAVAPPVPPPTSCVLDIEPEPVIVTQVVETEGVVRTLLVPLLETVCPAVKLVEVVISVMVSLVVEVPGAETGTDVEPVPVGNVLVRQEVATDGVVRTLVVPLVTAV